jgi:hypothetical protein
MARRPAALLAALALLLAAPGAALAQGAGDEQYSDPFGDEQTDHGSSGSTDDGSSGSTDDGSSGGGSTDDGAATQEPAAPEPVQSAPEPAAPEATAAAQQPPPAQLAYTGAEEGLVALAGAVLLVGGVALRVRLSEPAPRRR